MGMKKLLLLGTFVGITGLVHATTINAPASLTGFEVLNGNNAYSWGISIAVPTGEQVVSAEVDFTSVTLNIANSTGTGFLYTDLLESSHTGVGTFADADAPGDYWLGHPGAGLTSLKTVTFPNVGSTQTWSDVLTSTQLTALNAYLTANSGTFDIGIDPDCHYSVGNISFTYTFGSGPHTVPDVGATAFLLVVGLLGLEVFRRRFVVAKVKA
jgi:hypothetical protein